MLREFGKHLGIKCPFRALAEMREGLVDALRGKVSETVIGIIDRLLPKFAPEKGEGKNFRADFWDHLQLNYIQKGGDPDILNMWAESLSDNINSAKLFHESILGRDDIDRRSKYPDIWSAENIFYGLKHMEGGVEEGMMIIYGPELVKSSPIKLAKNLSLLFRALNDWIVGTKDELLNPVLHGIIDDLEKADIPFDRSTSSSPTEVHQNFHKWVIGRCNDAMAQNSHLLGNDMERINLYDKVNFFLGSTRHNLYKFEEFVAIPHAIRSGLDSALTIYIMLLFKISQNIGGNPDGTMSPEQKSVWVKSLQYFAVPGAQGSHAWAGRFFDVTGTRGRLGPEIDQQALDSMEITGSDAERHVTIRPEMHAVLKLFMMQIGLRRNFCPALRSSNGKAPAIFRLAELVRRWYDENKIQLVSDPV